VESPVSPEVGQAVLACQSAHAELNWPPKQDSGAGEHHLPHHRISRHGAVSETGIPMD
jgi:hypothetical protein